MFVLLFVYSGIKRGKNGFTPPFFVNFFEFISNLFQIRGNVSNFCLVSFAIIVLNVL